MNNSSSFLTLVFTFLCVSFSNGGFLGTYFPNWAQYRPSPYTFTPSSMSGVAGDLDYVWYAFAFFCPEPSWPQPYWITQLQICSGLKPFELTHPESKDPQFYSEIMALKNSNPNLKVILSVGGWTFPSQFFSGMASSSSNRATFIKSAMSWLNQYGFDGIDLDWEYPCSPARTDQVKIDCGKFDPVVDGGGATCSEDKENLVSLVKEMRNAFGSKYLITVASRAVQIDGEEGNFDAKNMAKYVDWFNLMSYDFTVSDITDSKYTAPNSPLYPPSFTPSISQYSISTAVEQYINAGVNASQLMIGIPYYGHTWYVPDLQGDDWKKFGLTAKIQGECCGPFQQTYGAKYGVASQQCGLLMYSEIQAAGFQTTLDNLTQSNIGYLPTTGKDGTAAGTWLGYVDKDAIKSIVQFGQKKGVRGAFVFDVSQDTPNTFELTKYIRNIL